MFTPFISKAARITHNSQDQLNENLIHAQSVKYKMPFVRGVLW